MVRRPYTISDPLEPLDALRERFQALGYLYFPQAVDAGLCRSLLDTILDQLYPHITRTPAGAPVLAREPFFETDAVWDEVYPKIQRLEAFHTFFHRPELARLMTLVAGEDHFVYPMKMARIATPRKIGYETPPHQDAYSHHAGPSMAGIWVALHDVDDSMGRVTVLPRSHLGGVRPVFKAEGVGGVQCEIHAHETEWHVSDYRCGDVLIFHSATVHRAEPNIAADKVRISVDTRFCDFGAPVFSTNLEPHHGWRIPGLDWDSIYRGWQSREYQYYWQGYPNLF
ncbi:phytanoyl-CoA dioxygenase family protein [Parahaliea aestuarii]|uniref:Phytanoyl-CoA dioxygenase family protein n=1 Tax=Parahaliea aestuarii TaxID=1852021 RepID=A0A5C9A7E2_9GAMM|nr:phytanoyl-CoA dioxygenase family protein [Parahaliea aestuarii]